MNYPKMLPFRYICVMIIAVVLSAGQAPDDNGNSEIISEWCSVDSDCIANSPSIAPAGVTCQLGFCSCTNGYVLHGATVCREASNPNPPRVRVVIEFTWDNLNCTSLPAGFTATLETDFRRIYGIGITIRIILKCGSVHMLAVMDDVDVDIAKSVNIVTAMQASQTVATVGGISVSDTYSGSGSCPISVGQREVFSIGGLCQPILCQEMYTINVGTLVEVLDTCTPPSGNDDLSDGAIVGIVIGSVGGLAIIIFIIYFLSGLSKSKPSNDLENGQQCNGPDSEENQNAINNGPDSEGI